MDGSGPGTNIASLLLLLLISFIHSLFSTIYSIQHPLRTSLLVLSFIASRHSTSFVLPHPPARYIHVFQPARLLGPKTQLLAWPFVCNWAYIRTTNINETSRVGVFDVIDLFQYLEGRVGSVQCTHPYIYSCRCHPFRPPPPTPHRSVFALLPFFLDPTQIHLYTTISRLSLE